MLTVEEILALSPAARGLLLGAGLKHLSRDDAQRLKESDAFGSLGQGAKQQVTRLINGSTIGRKAGTILIKRRPRFNKWLLACSQEDLTNLLAQVEPVVIAKLSQAIADSAAKRQAREALQQQIDELKAQLVRMEGQ